MKIGILKCTIENLVAIVPKGVSKLIGDKYEVSVEASCGILSHYTDQQYIDAGAKIASRDEILKTSDIILTVSGMDISDLESIPKTTLIIGKFNARVDSELVSALRNSEHKVFSLDLLPRITLAQSMDVLSSLASLSGYKASVLAANYYGGYFSIMTTSAGTIPPARVLVIGAGVAGLQAIATARRLGAVVEAFDVRSSVKEEVQSLGAKFIEVEGSREEDSAGGYAVEQNEDYIKKQKEVIHNTIVKSNIVISTASIPGKKAPLLIEEETVRGMAQGSIIIDLASSSGGNCAVSKDKSTISFEGVTIIGDSFLYNQMGHQASFVYSNNLSSFIKFMMKNGLDNIPYDHPIVSETLLSKQ